MTELQNYNTPVVVQGVYKEGVRRASTLAHTLRDWGRNTDTLTVKSVVLSFSYERNTDFWKTYSQQSGQDNALSALPVELGQTQGRCTAEGVPKMQVS